MHIVPILFPDGSILTEPSNAQLAAKLGMQTGLNASFTKRLLSAAATGLTAALFSPAKGGNTGH
jgi:hypothetical protein